MSFLSNLIKQVAPIVATVSPEPISKSIATGITVAQQQQEAKYQKKLAIDRQAAEEKRMSEIFGSNSTGLSRIQAPMGGGRITTSNAGFGSSIGSFFSDV